MSIRSMRSIVAVFVYASDALSGAGARALLSESHEVEVVGAAEVDRASVAVVVADRVDAVLCRVIGAIQDDGIPKVVVVLAHFDEAGVLSAVTAGATGFLRHCDADASGLRDAVLGAARGATTLPDSLLRRVGQAGAFEEPVAAGSVVSLGNRVGTTWPAVARQEAASVAEGGASAQIAPQAVLTAISEREGEILRLVADGYDTADIASCLSYSESTIKGELAKAMARLGARNRSHAVALAMRGGLI